MASMQRPWIYPIRPSQPDVRKRTDQKERKYMI